MVVYPIVIPKSKIENDKNLILDEYYPYIIYYGVALVKNGKNTTEKDLYLSITLKTLRIFILSITISFIACVAYFVTITIYLKYLLQPVQQIRKLLEQLIRERNSSEYKVDHNFDLIREKDENDYNSEQNVEYCYRNIETKNLEEMLIFLKKITLMKSTSVAIDYKERAKIYDKFLNFLEDLPNKSYLRQCNMIIAYSKYKENEYSQCYQALTKVYNEIIKEELAMIRNNEKIEHNLFNLGVVISDMKVPYLNEHLDLNIFQEDPEQNNFFRLRVQKQQVLYFWGIIKYLENCSLKNTKAKEVVINDGILLLKDSLAINTKLQINQVKSIFTMILLGKMYYEIEDITESSTIIKEALIKFSDINRFFISKELDKVLDARIMLLLNSLIQEQIFVMISKLCMKNFKSRLSLWVSNKIMDSCLFISTEVRKEINETIDDYIFKFESLDNVNPDMMKQYLRSKLFLEKNINRNSGLNKNISIVVSDRLLVNYFDSTPELKIILLKSIEAYISNSDIISYSQFGETLRLLFPAAAKQYNLKSFKENESFCFISNLLLEDTSDIHNALKDTVTHMCNEDPNYDKYILLFTLPDEFKFKSEYESRESIRLLVNNNVTLIVFVINSEEEKREKIAKMAKFLKNLVEGYVIEVNSFQIIEEIIHNLSHNPSKNSHKTILNTFYDNFAFIS